MEAQVQYTRRNRIHPQKFALYAAMASILMMFAAFTSAYLVRQAAGNWQEYRIPEIFFISTGVLLLSSATLHLAYRSFVQESKSRYRSLLGVTIVLGVSFVALQYMGWTTLYDMGVPLDGNPSGSFFYVISGVHAAHILGGVAALLTALYHAATLPFEVTATRKHRFSMVVHYWHFVDILWIYLLIFLLIAH